MPESEFWFKLIAKDKIKCKNYINENLNTKNLVSIFNDLICFSVLTRKKSNSVYHPVIIINVIKNLIGDDREQPSKILINFFIDFILNYKTRKNDDSLLNEVLKSGIGATAFAGDLEDIYQKGDWIEAEKTAAKFFLLSDKTRATMDILCEMALQDIPKNGLFVFHLLRAYEFQKMVKKNWDFTRCLMLEISKNKLPKPHKFSNKTPKNIGEKSFLNIDLALYSAMARIWNGDYVRLKGYQREISHWINDHDQNNEIFNRLKLADWLFKVERDKYIRYAEKVILDNRKQEIEKLSQLVLIDSVRAILKYENAKKVELLKIRLSK